ncbi:uncharacterized protein DUF4231 [Lentzea flaviverrucosa]|uniref:DUF4231 domain-containing protein n=2 Tax=Lentzea flaviverrucosa TaxID=200379 RepID=A0A1H9XXK2_9PSEU|nr:uncharacterized protein DUF4231 [Lentzea flaviverrucosa]SES50403.1 Protein of unknown function [Lentzea flaviverrucosa]
MQFKPPFFSELPDIKAGLVLAADKYATRLRAFYNARAIWHRRFYRLGGITVILIGGSLPLIANAEYPGKTLVVSLAGTAVAVLTSLHAFYRWDQSWVLLRRTEHSITAAYWQWRAALPHESAFDTDEAMRSTREFLKTLATIREDEASAFLKDLTFPAATALGQARTTNTSPAGRDQPM